PLDDLDRVAAAGEEVGDRLASELIALVLEPVDLDPVVLEAAEATQVLERHFELLALLDDDRRLLDCDGGWRLDPGQDERVGRLLDEVEDVVERADQGVDVLPIERRDERRFEPAPDLVADLVAAMLGVPDLTGSLLRRVVRAEHGFQQARRPRDVRRMLGAQVEEALFGGDEAESHRAQRSGARFALRVLHPARADCAGRIVSCHLGSLARILGAGAAVAGGRAAVLHHPAWGFDPGLRKFDSRQGAPRRALVAMLAVGLTAALTVGLPPHAASAATLPPGFTESVVFSGLTYPTAVRFSPDGRVFVAEKSGIIKVFDSLS